MTKQDHFSATINLPLQSIEVDFETAAGIPHGIFDKTAANMEDRIAEWRIGRHLKNYVVARV